MIEKSYPLGIPKEDYLPLLKILYNEMSDRNIIDVISLLTTKPKHIVQNDLYSIAIKPIDCNRVLLILKQNGYEDWLLEP